MNRAIQFTGKALQIIGLIVLPLSMYLQLSNALGRSLNVSQMVVMLLFGVLAFYLGRYLEGYAGSA